MPTRPCKRGHTVPRTTNGSCAQCLRENRKKNGHFTNNPATKAWRIKNRGRLAELRREYDAKYPEKRMLAAAKRAARVKSVPFNITVEDIAIPELCPVLGVRLEKNNIERDSNSPSLDRIIPALGYTKGNVMVISWRANRIKADATVDELRTIADFYSKLTKN